MRTIRCLIAALLTAGVAQSAQPPETVSAPHPPRIRFLSLAEARAIALERGNLDRPQLLSPALGSPNGIKRQSSGPIRVLAHPGHKGILITGIPRDPRPDEYERIINQMLLNVETAYWNLYGSYGQLHSREQALRFAYETWKIVGAKYKVGRVSLADFAQIEGQYNLFRSQRLQALDTVLDNERQLRAMLSLPVGEGVRLVPSEAPTLTEKQPDWQKALAKALKQRPELRLARKEVELAEAKVRAMEKVVPLPGRWLGPPDSNDAESKSEPPRLMSCAAWDYSWAWINSCRSLPRLHEAELQLRRTRLVLQDQELKTERFLGLEYRRISSAYFQIKAARKQQEAFAAQLRLRTESYRAGKKDAALDLLLEAQRFWADALATEYQAIVTYDNALCGWEYAKGNIMAHAHVRLRAEPPSDHKTVRAVAREHKRTRQQVRRASDVLADSPLTVRDDPKVLSLPSLWMSFPPLRDAEELSSTESKSRKAEGTKARLIGWKVSDIFPPPRHQDARE